MADGAAQDAAQHVAAPLVGREDAVCEEEGGGARVIGQHAVRHALRSVVLVRHPHRRHRAVDDVGEEVGEVVRLHPLQHGGEALQPHPRVDGGRRERVEVAVRVAVVLHEDEVPDLQELSLLAQLLELLPGHLGAALALGAQVEVDLAARAAGAGVGHLPEVVLVAQPEDALRLHPGDLQPQLLGLVVGVVHRHPQPLLRDAVLLRQQLPREADGVALEVVAEREVAEHLEKGVVPRGHSHLLQVVVLAARPYALLRRRRPREPGVLRPQEHLFERHHPRVREEQRGIVPRHQRRRGPHGVPLPGEVVEEPGADLVGAHV